MFAALETFFRDIFLAVFLQGLVISSFLYKTIWEKIFKGF